MRTSLITLLFTVRVLVIHAQETDVLSVQNDTAHIELISVDIDIQVIGIVASTVTKLTFYNPNDRILEGELNFPLAEGQNVHRFAMDINGKLREGVVVEKNLGRKAFEGVVRQAIDPGLLEKTVGNNYKARIYPIPAKGYKSILIGYEEELQGLSPFYRIVADYGVVKNFNLKVEVFNQEFQPEIQENDLTNLKFKKWRSSYLAELKKSDFDVTGTFSFKIPENIKEQVFRQKSPNGDFFYLTTKVDIPKIKKQLPSSLAIIWDASKSAVDRNIEKELSLIQQYIQLISDVDVRLLVFSNQIHSDLQFKIANGDSDRLLQSLRNITYDGGTSYQCLQLKNIDAEEILFFTDGLSNLDKLKETAGINTLHLISSAKSIDNDFARFLTKRTGGSFINLVSNELDGALELLSNVQYQFLGATFNHRKIEEVYPIGPVNLRSSIFSVTGKINSSKDVEVTLDFGVQGKILESRKITIPRELVEGKIDRLWANKKISSLLENAFHEPEVITNLGKRFGLVTPYTSLIVLDRIEDYVEYNIEPPGELRAEYELLLSQKKEEVKSSIREIIQLTLEDYEDRIYWWKENQKDVSIHKPKQDESSDDHSENSDESAEQDTTPIEEEPEIDQSTTLAPVLNQPNVDTTIFNQVIEGVVFHEDLSLPGVTIQIKGTQMGTMTNIDGAYKVRVREGDVLVFNYIGFSSTEISVNDEFSGDINLEEDVRELNEVVVVAFAEELQKSLTGAVTTIVPQQLQGRASGVQIQSSEKSTIIIRGNSSVNVGSSPLYVIDGEIASEDELNWLQPDEIASTNIIKGEHATGLYGNRAKDGVIVITTKLALEDELVIADSISSSFDPDFIIKEWEPDEPYIDSLKNTPSNKQLDLYLLLREKYGKAPSFYLVVGNFFIQNNQQDIGLRVLSNIVELHLENHELLKILAHKYLQLGELETSIFLFKRIVELRPDEPHSKRDLALAYQEIGEFQKALDILNEIITTDWDDFEDRFPMIKSTILHEMNNLIHTNYGLDRSKIDKALLIEMPVDIRVILDWNTLDTDLDLWITEPNGERCFYKNPLTLLGGRLTEDLMDGYGPEEYLLKEAEPGEYKMEINYFDERVQKVSGPITIQVSIFTNYGKKNQKVKRLKRELKGVDEVIEIGKFVWDKKTDKN